uniref:Silk gland serine protease n=1 Tax=Tineola bisselliella TaxID=93883 RepID=A0A891XHM1_TINBI|nr:silk gland serine protease [Tineola bisselliella]
MWRLLLILISVAAVQPDITPGCNYYQEVYPNDVFFVASPNYAGSYPKGVTCKWIASCPYGYCRADCYDVTIPPSYSCSVDKLLISKTGDENLSDGEMYCGTGATTVISSGSKISFGLITSSNSPGGRFRCKLTSVNSPYLPSCSCGYKKQNRIVNGTETGINEFPMMAALAARRGGLVACGAVIIDKRYLMSAAHCFSGSAKYVVIVGEHDTEADGTSATRTYNIDGVMVHPQYNSGNNDYDVALIRTTTDMQFSERVGPVCLPFKFRGSSFADTYVTALGWGTSFFGGPTSNTLQKVRLRVISDSTCQAKGVSDVTPRQLCTFEPHKDTCQFDSGGPLLYTDANNGLEYNIGIVSLGDFCATSKPAVNTRVTDIMDWITYNSPDATYCIK